MIVGAFTLVVPVPDGDSPNYSGGIPPTLGPDAARFSRCDFTMTIEAAPTLVTTPSTSADGFVTYVPGAGTVTATPAGASAGAASIARVNTKALFHKKTKRVNRAGPVRFKLTLSKAARTTLKKKKQARAQRQARLQAQEGQDGHADGKRHVARAAQARADEAGVATVDCPSATEYRR